MFLLGIFKSRPKKADFNSLLYLLYSLAKDQTINGHFHSFLLL